MLMSSGQPSLPAAVGIADAAGGVYNLVVAKTELMRRDPRQLRLQLLRGMKRRTAEHDRHPAADRRVGRQTRQRIRPDHADQIGLDLEDFADHR